VHGDKPQHLSPFNGKLSTVHKQEIEQMVNEIEIVHCALCKPIDRDEVKYRTDIIATSCSWLESLDNNNSLRESPIIGQTYYVTLKPPVKFWLNMNFWLYYDSPSVSINGYETEQEVEQSKFCFGEITSIVGHNESGATIGFAIKETLTFHEILATKPLRELPEFWTEFYYDSLKEDNFSLMKFGKYIQLSVTDAQGDIGLQCIVTKVDNQYLICKMTHWSFHEEYTFGGKYILPKFIREKVLE